MAETEFAQNLNQADAQKLEDAITESVNDEVKNLRERGFSKAHISENSFEIEDEVIQRFRNNPELFELSSDERRDFVALEKRFNATDFNYGFADDSSERVSGREQVGRATEAFQEFATKSDLHASLASRAWDNATDIVVPPKEYVHESQRERVIGKNNTRTDMSESHSMDIDVTQHPVDIRDAVISWAEENAGKIAQLDEPDRKEVTDQLYKTLDHIEGVLDKDYQAQWSDGPAKGSVFVEPYMDVVVGDTDMVRKRAVDYLPEGSDPRRLANLEKNRGLEMYVLSSQEKAGYENEIKAWEAAYSDFSSGRLTDGHETMQDILTAADKVGIDSLKFEERLMIGASGARQEEEWAVSDIEAVVAARGLDGTQDEDIAQATSVVTGLYEYTSAKLDDLYNRHHEYSRAAFQAQSETIIREMETFKATAFESPEAEQEYLRMFRAEFGAAGMERIADGDLSMLERITTEPDEQRSIAHTALKLEARHRQMGMAQEALERGLELHDPAPGHEQDGFTL